MKEDFGLKEDTMEEANGRKKFNPQKYGLKFCENCRGLGKSTSEARVVEVCRECGGFGLVKMEGQAAHNTEKASQWNGWGVSAEK